VDLFKPLTKKQERTYDRTINIIREEVGSYQKIATTAFSITGLHISGQTVHVWFIERRIPEKYAVIFCSMVPGKVDFMDLCPWLLPVFNAWQQEKLNSGATNGWDK